MICVQTLNSLLDRIEMNITNKENLLKNLAVFIQLNINMYSDTYVVLLVQSKSLLGKLADRHVRQKEKEVRSIGNWVISLIDKISERCLSEKDSGNYPQPLLYNNIIQLLSSLFWYFTIVLKTSSILLTYPR